MKIRDIKSYVLKYDLNQELGFSQSYFNSRTAHIVEVFTDEGVTGIGEVFGSGNIALGNSAIIDKVIKPMIIGDNPLYTESIWHKVYNNLRDHGQKGMPIQCLSGVDIALWDIIGKVYGKPLYVLLGGKFRNNIKVYGYGMLFRKVKDLAQSFAEEAVKLKEMGFDAIKMKIGKSPEEDIILVESVRNAIGYNIKLMVDANHAYNTSVSIPLGRELERLKVYWFEEPVAPEDIEGYLETKNSLDIPIAGGECEFTRWGFKNLISNRCVDILQPEVCACGGITEFRKIVAMASSWGIPIVPHVWGSSIAIAVNIHIIASLPDVPGAFSPVEPMLEYDTTPNIFREKLSVEPINVLDNVKKNKGYIEILEKPGIGIELERRLLKHYKIN